MISDISFATGFQSFWDNLIPYVGNYIKIKNLEDNSYDDNEVLARSSPDRRSLIAEYAFRVFCWELNHKEQKVSKKIENEIRTQTVQYIAGFGDVDFVEGDFSKQEQLESQEIIESLRFCFKKKVNSKLILTSPSFMGCGFLDACSGDIISNETLFEIKTVDRSFRATDLKQLLVYAALNSVSKQYRIKKLGLINPRRFKFIEEDIEYIAAQISGKSSQQLFDEIVFFISSGDLSK